MKKLTTEGETRKNNLITVIFCLVVVLFSAIAIFLSAYDWHTDTILGSANVGGDHTQLEGTIPLASQKAISIIVAAVSGNWGEKARGLTRGLFPMF